MQAKCNSTPFKRRLSSNSSSSSPSASHIQKRLKESSFHSNNSADNMADQKSHQTQPFDQPSLSPSMSQDIQGSIPMPRFNVNVNPYGVLPPGMTSSPIPGLAAMQPMPQQSMLTDFDIQRIALAVKNLMADEIKSQVESQLAPFRDGYNNLVKENKFLHNRIDELEQYGRKNCVRIFGVSEDKTDTDAVVLEIGRKLEVPIQQSDIAVSHRVGPSNTNKPRPIIARITSYSARHLLLKGSKKLRNIEGMSRVSINQDLTKRRAKLAYEARQLVKKGHAKSTFVFDGKIFLVDANEKKHAVKCLDDLFPFGYTNTDENPSNIQDSTSS
ncbi:hypothetical protein FSP39_000598 [Pinctada imbricata]|uniref:Uncharacterized protein n=1 Tax=Pinctada imbricata TaxID=66713 RepID=A0AA88Y2E2_PINIB|nr:hypothetical protein FSP39_000598 [Pinctada imbricata]